jgi:hypothetical protein
MMQKNLIKKEMLGVKTATFSSSKRLVAGAASSHAA